MFNKTSGKKKAHNSLIFKNIADGNIDGINALLDVDIDINSKDSNGDATPLICAARTCNTNIAQLLLKHGADKEITDDQGRNVLHNAVDRECIELVTLLLSTGLNVNAEDHEGYTPAWIAVMKSNNDILRLLIASGANIHQVVNVFGDDDGGAPMLTVASYYGSVPIIETLIEHGANVNQAVADGQTPFLTALFEGKWEAAKYLLDKCDDHIINFTTEKYKNSALLRASMNGESYIIEKLLDRGADVDKANTEGTTALIGAIEFSGSQKALKLLIKRGANVNACDMHHNAPLHYAAEKGDFNLVKLLLMHGANREIKTEDGVTPMDLAISEGHYQIRELLEMPENTDTSEVEQDCLVKHKGRERFIWEEFTIVIVILIILRVTHVWPFGSGGLICEYILPYTTSTGEHSFMSMIGGCLW